MMAGRDTGQVPFRIDGLAGRLFLVRAGAARRLLSRPDDRHTHRPSGAAEDAPWRRTARFVCKPKDSPRWASSAAPRVAGVRNGLPRAGGRPRAGRRERDLVHRVSSRVLVDRLPVFGLVRRAAPRARRRAGASRACTSSGCTSSTRCRRRWCTAWAVTPHELPPLSRRGTLHNRRSAGYRVRREGQTRTAAYQPIRRASVNGRRPHDARVRRRAVPAHRVAASSSSHAGGGSVRGSLHVRRMIVRPRRSALFDTRWAARAGSSRLTAFFRTLRRADRHRRIGIRFPPCHATSPTPSSSRARLRCGC